ncbi:MAG: FAD-dependent oxidoreductase [Planctomycetes bacterium]|nr:FAD-dependent oxidoreductase [Planctomycetota bacterium]
MPSIRPSYYDAMLVTMSGEMVDVDVCVYGGTAAGLASALQVTRMGRSVVLIEPSRRVGGLVAAGRSWSGVTAKPVIGGLAREFQQALARHYGVDHTSDAAWSWEPHVAEALCTRLLSEAKVAVRLYQFAHEVQVTAGVITHLLLEGGMQVRARMFIDATAEGDLLALAQVPWTSGREAGDVYDETLAGVQRGVHQQFEFPVDPYIVPGQAASGRIAGVSDTVPAAAGSGDQALPAACFSLCLTRDADKRLPFVKPQDYDPQWYELHLRYFATGWTDVFSSFLPIPGNKTEAGSHGPIGMDVIGQNHAWVTSGYTVREEIFQAHRRYQQGLLWFLANDRRVPERIRQPMAQWGLCNDEFITTAGWPERLHLPTTRRMVGDHVITEHEVRRARLATDVVALAGGDLRLPPCQRVIVDGRVQNDGALHEALTKPFPVSWRALIPPGGSVQNLLVPVCLSASHVASGALTNDAVRMALGQAAATAACQLIAADRDVHDLDYPTLRAQLLQDGQVLG